MKPDIDRVYVWNASKVFKDIRRKELGHLKISDGKKVVRYAKNATVNGKAKTLLLLTDDTSESRVDKFLSQVTKKLSDQDKKLFATDTASPQPTSVEYS